MSLYDDALAVLSGWHPRNDQQRRLQASYVQHLYDHREGLHRECHPDHITASTLVVSVDRTHVLLHLHRKHEIWMQFGGHCEATDETLAGAALREASEESGIADLRLLGTVPVQLSTHAVQCGPLGPAHHLDVRYLAEAPTDARVAMSQESLELSWFDRQRLPSGVDASLHELIEWCLSPARRR